MKNPFEILSKKEKKEPRAEDLPQAILKEFKNHSIDPKDIESVKVDNSESHIDGRLFYKILLSNGDIININFIGEGHIVEKFEIESRQ